MTEVDYSPEAYQRYMATRTRVDNWAVDASAHRSEYTHPFESHHPRRPATAFGPVPEVRPSDSISLYEPPERHHRRPSRERALTPRRADPPRSREHSRSRDPAPAAREIVLERPRRERAMTAPHAAAHPSVAHPAPPPQPMYYMQPTPPLARRDSHGSRPAAATAGPLVRRDSHFRARSPPPSPHAAPNYRTVDLRQHAGPPGVDVQLPHPRPGEAYMIIPPAGRRVEVVNKHPARPYTVRIHATPASAPTSPTHAIPPAPFLLSPARPTSHPTSRARSPVPPHYSHAPVQPSPLHTVGPYTYAVPHQQEPSPTKKKAPPLLKRLLTSTVTWGEKPASGRRLSN